MFKWVLEVKADCTIIDSTHVSIPPPVGRIATDDGQDLDSGTTISKFAINGFV